MLRVGIVGTAFGESRCRMVADTPEATLVAVAGRDRERTQTVATRFGCDVVIGYQALVARPDIDVIGVFTSTETHAEIAIAAARAGKHVITSKPTATSIADAEAMLAASRAADRRLIVEFDTRYLAGPFGVYRAIADGRLGRLIQGDYVNKCYRGQAYYDEAGGWRGIAARGGGCVLNQGVHAVDHLLWYHGRAEGVFALTGTYAHHILSEDAASAVIHFEDGSMATYTATTTFRTNIPAGRYGGNGTLKRAQIHGTNGSATVVGDNITDWIMADGETEVPELGEVPARNVFQDFARTVSDAGYRSSTLVADEDALQSVYLCAAIRQSAASGKYVRIRDLGEVGAR